MGYYGGYGGTLKEKENKLLNQYYSFLLPSFQSHRMLQQQQLILFPFKIKMIVKYLKSIQLYVILC